MAAGAIGSVWETGTWSDLAWEEDTWGDAVVPTGKPLAVRLIITIEEEKWRQQP